MKTYRITEGGFVMADGSVKGKGAQIELDDDVATLHASMLCEVKPGQPSDSGVEEHGDPS